MFLYDNKMLMKEECNLLVKKIKRYSKSMLYFKSNFGKTKEIFKPNQRNSLEKSLLLNKGTSLYNKIDSIVKEVGFTLNSDKIKFKVLKYKKGHFIFKHRHNHYGDIFLTFVIQLSDSTDYEGGDFKYWIKDKEYKLNREIGHGIIIGPEIEHEVEIVTSGERHSLVLFLNYSEVKSLTKTSII